LVVQAEIPVTPPAPAAKGPPRRPDGVDHPHNEAFLARLVQTTPARIAAGRTGTRYRAETYLALRADHAIAKDAVEAELPASFSSTLGCLEVVSRCPHRAHYLLHPNDGRRLSDESRAVLGREGDRGFDVQVIVADGLSSPALETNGPRLLPALIRALKGQGMSVGRPILARFARVGLQDDIGVLLGARATAICLGERPGLGTGDSLSIYLAVGPKLDQDNAEKNCISNIRPQGLLPESAADMAASLLRRGLDLGRSGLELV
jgi:ethanolamine ammonia-lyase small subunit